MSIKGTKMNVKVALLAVAGLGCAAAFAASEDVGDNVIAVGPVDLVEASSITVLGRSYGVGDTSGLVVGDKVAVHGALRADGTVLNASVEPMGPYVAGADPVFETGVVTDVNEVFGRLSIGGSEVDYTNALAETGSAVPAVGDLVSVSGIQPVAGGVLLGTTTRATAAIIGGGAASAAIIGGGAGSAAIIGGGAGRSAIIGGGASSSAIIGGGAGRSAIIGGGAGSSAIIGGGAGSSAIIGGGAGSSAIIGGGAGSSAIIGGGAGSSAIIGGGAGSAAIIGGGASAAAIIGGGDQ